MNLGTETETLEFKRSTGELKEAVDSIGAILNKRQKGELYFGVQDDGEPVGQPVTEKTLRDVWQSIRSHIEPEISPEIQTVAIDGRQCVYVRFEGDDTPYLANNVARIRVADEDRPMSRDELVAYVLRRNEREGSWEERVSPCAVDDADERQVRMYVARGQAAKRIEFGYTDKMAALNELRLTNGNQLLNAGMALFAESPYSDLQMAVFAGTERLTFLDIQRKRSPVFDLISTAEKYVASNIRWRVEFDGSLQRKEIPEIPMEAVREALINSFCHKDYGALQSNEVSVYKDRVEIYNPGRFPEGRSPEDFIRGAERPVRRNPLIASVLYYSKDVESFGTGLKRIANACRAARCRFEFKTAKSGFVVVFYRAEAEPSAGFKPGSSAAPEATAREKQQTGSRTAPSVAPAAPRAFSTDTLQASPSATPQASPATPQVSPGTPQVSRAGTPQVSPGTPQVSPAGTPQVSPATPQVPPGTPQVSPATPQVPPGTPKVSPATPQETLAPGDQKTKAVLAEILRFCSVPRRKSDIVEHCGLSDLKHFSAKYLRPLMSEGMLQMTFPDKPRSSKQRYVTSS